MNIYTLSVLVCRDAPDVGRLAIHRQIETEISDFLHRSL
jgi:hypothetical protein